MTNYLNLLIKIYFFHYVFYELNVYLLYIIYIW